MTVLANRLRSFRQRKRLSLARLAKLSGISTTYLWELETGAAGNPSVSVAVQLAKSLGVTLDQLVGDLEEATERKWKPLAKRRLEEIRQETMQDVPDQNYCAAEIYDMACELTELRKR